MDDTPKRYNWKKNIKLVVMLLIPIVLIALPANFFDTGDSICISVLLLDTECYACGLTRAVQHLIHLDFATAFAFNKLVVIVFPLIALLWLKAVLELVNIRILQWL